MDLPPKQAESDVSCKYGETSTSRPHRASLAAGAGGGGCSPSARAIGRERAHPVPGGPLAARRPSSIRERLGECCIHVKTTGVEGRGRCWRESGPSAGGAAPSSSPTQAGERVRTDERFDGGEVAGFMNCPPQMARARLMPVRTWAGTPPRTALLPISVLVSFICFKFRPCLLRH